jgi:Xaa-Pro aminopeptidase
MAVDWEERVDYDRLRRERLARAKILLEASELGALLCFDMNNIRYLTATHIGTWAIDKMVRFALLPQNDEPMLWDFGSAARHHQLYSPWLGERSRAGISTLRGAINPKVDQAGDVARKVKAELEERGLAGEPLGVDVAEIPVLPGVGRPDGGRRAAAHAGGPQGQDRGRDHASEHRLRHGGWRLREPVPGNAPGHAGERMRGPRDQAPA